jgi:hypothetical protein
MPTTTSTTTFGGVETSNADSSKHTPRESRDLPPLLSSSYPITLKVQKQICNITTIMLKQINF